MASRTHADDKISTSFKISKRLHTELKMAAAGQGRDIDELVEDALQTYLLHSLLKNAH